MKRLILSGVTPDLIKVLLIPLLIVSICSISKATVIHVPADKSTVQAGVDSADFGDTVLVAPGTYVENILLDNKSIVLTSNFMFDKDPAFIYSTILDGSSPTHPDTGSVLRLIGFSVDSTTVVQGFTITNGNGTVWTDEHGAGVYREGGGILTTYSSPIIRYNLIINNQATQGGAGITSAGGGAIRSGDGNPRILNNMILYNQGRYGAGIVLNFAYGVITNNVIAYNTGGQDYAGGGIWKYANGANGGVALIENNTIAYNQSLLPGGGVFIWNTSATLINNLIWANIAPSDPQIGKDGATIVARNCNVQGGYTGTGTDNIDSNPFMFGNYLYTSGSSPCIDTGDTAVAYFDIEDPGNLGFSIWPSFGTLRNDIGAYGGPEAFSFEPVAAYADSTIGWAPLPVNFEGYTALSVNSWHWNFGDDSTGTGQNPSHTYLLGGNYDIGVVVDTGGDSVSSVFEKVIYVLADTMSVTDNEGGKGDTIEIPVYANNNIPIKKILVPFQYPGNLDLILIAASTAGCRTEDFEVQTYLWYDPGGKQFYYRLETTSDLLPPGSGPILKLKFMVPEDADDNDSAIFSLVEFSGKPPKYSGPLLEYEPVTIDAKISVTPCCVGTRGDANGDGFPNANILDLNFLVNYIFRSSGDPGPCLPESNVNGDATALPNVLDVNFLVNYIFRLGPAPGPC